MVILLPNRLNGLALLESSLSSKLLDLIDRRWNKIQVDVVIPIFKFESSPDLKRVLRNVGIVDLFNDDADLSGISGSKDLYVSDAFHRTIIEVNEKGTEAAAATSNKKNKKLLFSLKTSFQVFSPEFQKNSIHSKIRS